MKSIWLPNEVRKALAIRVRVQHNRGRRDWSGLTVSRCLDRLLDNRARRLRRSRVQHLIGFLEIKIDQVLGFRSIDAEVLRHVDEGVARVVGHAVRVQPAQPQHPHEIFFWIERLLATPKWFRRCV